MPNKQDFILSKPVMNAAGYLGFSPDPRRMLSLEKFGAFVTNPVSLLPRTPAKNREYIPFENGMLLHTGLVNPGLDKVILHNVRQWEMSTLPIILHGMIQEIHEIKIFLSRVEDLPGIGAVEFSFSPILSIDQINSELSRLVSEVPIILHLDPGKILELRINLLKNVIFAISLRYPRGELTNASGEFTQGRYFSHALLPQTLYDVKRLKGIGLPIFAGAGITTNEDIDLLLKSGASAVQLGPILWD